MFSRAFRTRFAAAAVVLGSIAAPAAAQEAGQGDAKLGDGVVYVNVTDDASKTLPLTAADVTIKEDGRAREVLRVEKATGPVQIALLVDDSQAAQSAIADLRAGLKAFVAKMLAANPESQIALITFGERPTLVTDYTSSAAQLERGISRIFARPNSGAYMLEAIVSATRGILKRDAARSHIIVVGTEGVEFSNDHQERVLDDIAESGATLWALTLTAGPRANDTDETRNRSIVLGRGTVASGGRQDQVLANSAVTSRLDRLGDLILNQYAVTYGRSDTLVPPKKIDVTVSVPGAKVLAPENAPRPRKAGGRP